MRVRNYGLRVVGRPWDFSPPKRKPSKKVKLQLWREDLGYWFTVREFPKKCDAEEYAKVKDFDLENYRIV